MAWPAPAAYLSWSAPGASGPSYLCFDVVTNEEDDEGTTVTEHPVEVGANVADHVRVELVKITLKVRSTNEPIPMANPAIPAGQPFFGSGMGDGVLMPLSISVSASLPNAPISTITVPTWVNNITARALLETATGAIGGAVGGQVGGAVGAIAGGLLGALLFAPKEEDVTFAPALNGVVISESFDFTASTFQWNAGTDYVAELHQLLVALKNAAQIFTVSLSKGGDYPSMVIETLNFVRSSDTGSGEEITLGFKQVLIVTTQTVAAPIPNLSAGGGTPPVNKGSAGGPPAPTTSAAADLLAKIGYVITSVPGG